MFRSSETVYEAFRETLAAQLRTTLADITVVGSAKIGFSLDPDKFGAAFNVSSDVDTVIVNAVMFDTAWAELVKVGQRRYALEEKVHKAFKNHRTNNIFFGYVLPSRLPGIVSFANDWFQAFQGLGRIRSLSDREVNGRLYRTWDHVRAHQAYSLDEIAKKLKMDG